ncbi:MAG: cytochrome c oxidase subunit II [Phycisphaerales bacterium]|nr:cytochrome c oxidase subunit II [Phycisphaerales bacterium]
MCSSSSQGATDSLVVCLPDTTNNMFEPVSQSAREIRELSWLVLGICAAIGLVVEAVLVWSILRFRARPHAAKGEPSQVYGSNSVEIAWTVVPCVIVFVLTLATVRTIREVELTEPPSGALMVIAIGHQWWWEYRYEAEGVVTANELVVPVGRPVWLTLLSADVIHSWWVPRLTGKTDLVPNWTNHTWFNAEQAGIYKGQCAEYCGTQHGGMFLRVEARAPAEFAAWIEEQKQPASVVMAAEQGHQLFTELACMNCHEVVGTSDGTFGPSLTHLMSRSTIGSGVAPLDRDTLRLWIADPSNLKPGCNMPSLKLNDEELDAMVGYLLTLR